MLCATTVAEEGVDIGRCSLVVTFNQASSAVGRVQRIGRARAVDSRAVLLALGGGVVEQELAAVRDAQLMQQAVRAIADLGEKELERQVRWIG